MEDGNGAWKGEERGMREGQGRKHAVRQKDGWRERKWERVSIGRETTPLEAPLSQKHDCADRLVVVRYEDMMT